MSAVIFNHGVIFYNTSHSHVDMTRKKQPNLKRNIIYIGASTLLLMVITHVIAIIHTWEVQLQVSAPPNEGLTSTFFNTTLLEFVADHWVLIANSFLGGCIVLALFVSMYRNANKLYLALNASTHDKLTGLYNRRYLDNQFERLWLEAKRDNTPISVLFIDIDHFKRFNDRFGHEKGDAVLINVAKAICQCLRRPLDFCCRWGGEEFVVVMPQTSENGALDVADRILNAISEICTDFCGPGHTPITVSIGVAATHVTADNIHDDLVDQSDKAMMAAKVNGRNRIEVYDMQH